jgi:hypothetical protein
MSASTTRAVADDGCCAHCACHTSCQKVCRLICEEKKVEVLCWGCKCEDFCVARHSTPGCEHCETVCGDCGNGDAKAPHSEPKRFIWFDWIPHGAQMYTRKKLMRKTETVTVPSYKWVVEDMCPECTAKLEATDRSAIAKLPVAADAPASR